MPIDSYGLWFLETLERAEAELLSWGYVDGAFSDTELEERAEGFLEAARRQGADPSYASGWEMVEGLVEAGLLWSVPLSGRFRTRSAEAVRLFARLRQIFAGGGSSAWRTAPPLVADYRFLTRPRLHVERSITPKAVTEELRAQAGTTLLEQEIASALLRLGTGEQRALAGFQLRAATRILRDRAAGRPLGTVVCAGTGSGKSLAFYLPAYMTIASDLSSGYWTKCLAVYPRSELLKDQLREALANARRASPVLLRHGRRKIVIGALYGATPNHPRAVIPDASGHGWRVVAIHGGQAYECPYIRCPACGEPMVWLDGDVRAGTERLECIRSACGERLESNEIRLTRVSMMARPPDILFTTTEMLNRHLFSARFGGLYGIGMPPDRRPRFVLVDEAHTYEGVHGAHVAYLLRRWRRATDARPHFVGLSATLADAGRFFSQLTGIGPGDVIEIAPEAGELTRDGAEYLLAIRGDPASGTSLLSTTIQALMLLRRILAPRRGERFYGSRVFAFTDNLDVINRLFHDLQDAEGLTSRGQPNPRRPGGSLANLRASSLPDARDRLIAGQNWILSEILGHSLAPGTRAAVGRTSSQDAGVDARAEIVVATSSLEVGFDDPDVGAVLQHKAPQSSSAFVQRKGRAGRRTEMRPWTVVVLSDYGRDRRAYQNYDQLFSPELPPRRLPLGNRSVLRMQATYALLDWLARRLPPGESPEPWMDLAQPADELTQEATAIQVRRRQQFYTDQLRLLLEQSTAREEFAAFLGRCLDIDPDGVSALLWEPPRAVLTEAVPALLRRLERQWRRASGGVEHHVPHHPLPEFVPRALFNDLQLPEVAVRIPASGTVPGRVETMPLAQALREFATGRVSRRFGVSSSAERYWISPGTGGQTSVESFCPVADRHALGFAAYRDGGSVVEVQVFRPYALDVSVPPVDVKTTANAFLDWHAEVVPDGDGHELDLPEADAWNAVLDSIRCHTHQLVTPVAVYRFAPLVTVSIARRRGATQEGHTHFSIAADDGSTQPAAVGFVADVDAIQVKFRYPSDLYSRCQADARLARALRINRFGTLVADDPRLDALANTFQRSWLAEVYLATLTAEVLRTGVSLDLAASAVRERRSSVTTDQVLRTILRQADVEMDEGDEEESAEDAQPIAKRERELLDLLTRDDVWRVLGDAAQALTEPIGVEWEGWLRAHYKATLAAGFIDAVQDLCPSMSPEELVVDLDARPRHALHSDPTGADEFWISEQTLGGAGFVEEWLVRYAEDPRRFLRLLDGALAPSDMEQTAAGLERILEIVASDSARGEAFRKHLAAVRTANSHAESARALGTLRDELGRHGILPTTSLMVSLTARVLRPGTGPSTDAFLAELLSTWQEVEERLGIDIDPRVFAFVRSHDVALDEAIGRPPVGGSADAQAAWRYGVLYGLLWPRGMQVRSETLGVPNPFRKAPACDRLLVTATGTSSVPEIDLGTEDWFARLSSALIKNGIAVLSVRVDESSRLADALLRVASTPVDSATLLVYARLVGVERDEHRIRARLELPEAFQ